jgi:hypothetical protein
MTQWWSRLIRSADGCHRTRIDWSKIGSRRKGRFPGLRTACSSMTYPSDSGPLDHVEGKAFLKGTLWVSPVYRRDFRNSHTLERVYREEVEADRVP